jgi:hypothetical protein
MKTIKPLIAASVALSALPAGKSWSANLQSSLQYKLRAEVATLCNIENTIADVREEGVMLKIVSNCNASQFYISVARDGRQAHIRDAQSYTGGASSMGGTAVFHPSRPGAQYLTLLVEGEDLDQSALSVQLRTS